MADVKGMCFENEISVKTFSARYQKLGEMGSGSFGTVSLCRMKPGVIDSQKREMATRQGTLMRPLSINIKYMNDLVAIKTMNIPGSKRFNLYFKWILILTWFK